ncbi:kelch repeat and BTB domain-containing protein 4-like [Drosophila guanche]|uniref:Blast:Kelch-like protein 40a n=1 Tax=Drosophila guanche TaxID=7266 RepID=A0A3B0JUD2_DROGU|nr:kelch repeat and BTB domain-containing protein 4-like [Drosophila guanche]SPP84663.1 blast:Kelch-like protein 40a [Drosophila guanche]
MDTWLQPVFTDLLENKKFADCLIVVEPETFDCHKVILASASEFFERMFLGDFKESKCGQFIVNDVMPKTFKYFLEYIYTYNSENLKKYNSTVLMDLLVVGTKWLVASLQSDCVKILTERAKAMTIGDLLDLFQGAHNVDNESLINVAKAYLKTYKQRMNCYEALMLTSDVFEQYLIIADGCIEEVERFKMIQAYVKVNGLHVAETSDYSVDAEADNKEASGVLEIEDVKKVGEGIRKELCEVKPVGDTATKAVELDVGNQQEMKVKAIHSKYVRTLLGYINYKNMNKTQFYTVVGKSSLLDIKEKFEKLYLTS